MKPAVTPPTPENQARLAEQVRRRRQLVDMLATEKQRLSGLDDVDTLASIREHLAFLKGQIGQCDARIKSEIEADDKLARKAVLPESIPGIGATTAAVLIAELPELGIADKKQIAALAGVAPMNRDSGAGWAQIGAQASSYYRRQALGSLLALHASPELAEAATLPAIRFNPAIRDFYQHLRAEGKAPKVAITAAMRKLLIIANAIIQQNRPWTNPS